MLPVLCEAYPAAASIPDSDSHGRLPLHTALALGHSWEGTAKHLFDANPSATIRADPLSGLPCFVLAGESTAPITDQETERVAKELDERNYSLCWSYLPKREKAKALERASLVVECQRLTTMYEVLRRNPSVLEGLADAPNTKGCKETRK